jgi:hypothetical protein
MDSNDYWIVTDTASTIFPCSETDASKVTYCDYDAAANTYDCSATLPAPAVASGERTVETRQVNILLEAELAADAEVQKDLQVAVNIRNNRLRTEP